MPLRMSLMERMVFVHSNLGPGPMADMFGGLAFKAVLAAVEIGVFEGLADGAARRRLCDCRDEEDRDESEGHEGDKTIT